MTQLLDDLKAVRDLLAVPERWTQGAYARTARGTAIDPLDERACCFCVIGAARKVSDSDGDFSDRVAGVAAALEAICHRIISEWQDGLPHADVLALLDKAISAEERK